MSSAKLSSIEIKRVKWLIGYCLSIISISGLFTIDIGSNWLEISALVLLITLGIRPKSYLNINIPYRLGVVGILVFIVWDFINSSGDLIPPLVRMITLLILYRTFQYRNRRYDLQLILLTFFLIVICGVLSQDLIFALQLLIYAPFVMVMLFFVNLDEEIEREDHLKSEVFKDFKWKKLYQKLKQIIDFRFLLFGGSLFMLGLVMSASLFFFLPRFELGQALPFLKLRTAQSMSGFSDEISFGDVIDIIQDDGIAMRIDVTEGYRPASPYWRMVALDGYYDGGFQVSSSVRLRSNELRSEKIKSQKEVPTEFRNESNNWTFYFEGSISSYLPTVGEFTELKFKNRQNIIIQNSTRVLLQKEINASTLFYRLENVHGVEYLPFSEDDLNLITMKPLAVDTSSRDYLRKVAYPQTMLCYPEEQSNEVILRTASTAIGIQPDMSVKDFIERTVTYLQLNRGYSLSIKIPEGEADTVLRWLASGESGHCELYASAFTLLARYNGFACRIITGFVGGDWNGYENYYMVRNRNAHAWCEIYDQNEGWIRVDPTPGNNLLNTTVDEARKSGQLFTDRTFGAYMDSLKVLWFRRIVNFNQEDQEVVFKKATDAGKRWMESMKMTFLEFKSFIVEKILKLISARNWIQMIGWMAGIFVTFLSLTIFIRYFYRVIYRGSLSEELRLRKKAGVLLNRIKKRKFQESEIMKIRSSLEVIRYASRDEWPDTKEVFSVAIKKIRER